MLYDGAADAAYDAPLLVLGGALLVLVQQLLEVVLPGEVPEEQPALRVLLVAPWTAMDLGAAPSGAGFVRCVRRGLHHVKENF